MVMCGHLSIHSKILIPSSAPGATEEVPCLNMRAREGACIHRNSVHGLWREVFCTHRVGIVPACLCRGLLHKEAREDTVGM